MALRVGSRTIMIPRDEPGIHGQLKACISLPLFYAYGVQALGCLPLKWVFVVSSFTDAALHYAANRNVKWFQAAWKAETVAPFIIWVLALNWSFGYLLQELAHRKVIEPLSMDRIMKSRWNYGIQSWGIAIGILWIAGKVVEMINKWQVAHQKMERLEKLAEGDLELQKSLQEVKISWDKPFNQKVDQWLYVLQTTVTISLAVFSRARPIFVLATALHLYTLYRMTNRTWMSIVREIDQSANGTRLRFVYQPIFIQDTKRKKEEECSICLNSMDQAYYFCQNHSYDQQCLTSLFIKATEKFRIVNQITRISHVKNGVEQKATYQVYAQTSMKPSCPLCRCAPLSDETRVYVWDLERGGWCDGDITWLDYQPDQEIEVKITDFTDQSGGIAYGQLKDTTYVEFFGDYSHWVGTTVRGKIQSITEENGSLYLRCEPNTIS